MRRFAVLALLLAVLAPGRAQAADCLQGAGGIDLQRATIPDLQAAMAAGRLTAQDLVRASLGRIDAYDRGGPRLTSVREVSPAALEHARRLDAERAAGRVRGPLHGIPLLLKDNIDTADLPTTAGSIALEGTVPALDATITARLREAGAIVLGKANLSEFANWVDLSMPSGYSSLGGQVLNAHDLEASPLGSSSGSGVAASMALATAAIGTETSGSIISPAIVNGVVGVKPTLGLTSRAGIIPLAPQFDVPGPMARTVTDAAAVLAAIAGPDPRDPASAAQPPVPDYLAALRPGAARGVRLAFSAGAREMLVADERALFDAALARLRALGATVVEARALEAQDVAVTELAIIPNAFKASLNRYLEGVRPPSGVRTLSDIVAFNETRRDRVKYGQSLLVASDLTPGDEGLADLSAAPVVAGARAVIAAALQETGATAIVGPGFAHVNLGAAAGHPTVVVPAGYGGDGRAPFGLAFLGPRFSEAQLLGLAHAFEQDARARVAPTDLNAAELVPAGCPAAAAATALPRLRVVARSRGRALVVRVRGALGRTVRVAVRRGGRSVAVRRVRVRRGAAVLRLRLRAPRRATVVVLDPGPPPRSVRVRVGPG